jgi:hypothetical protein
MIRFLFAVVVLYFLFQFTIGDTVRAATAADDCPATPATTVVKS